VPWVISMQPYSRSEEHVGEWKLTLWADTVEELFAEAARVVSRECGLTAPPALPDSGEGRLKPGEGWERVTVTARDTETLLVDWLNELLGRSEINHHAYPEVRELKIVDGHLDAEIRGRPVTSWRSSLKAATYHGLQLGREGNRWKAVVLLDV
jgi:SHS2 domain-containing protein